MKVLSIDTATNICGVSIISNKEILCNLDSDTGRTHSENLMPMIQEAFRKTNLSLNNIDLITCDIGPGSFTGIRIGVATAKAFCDSLDIPCVGVSSLEVLSYNLINEVMDKQLVCSIIDCKNSNCYFALYQKKGEFFECLIEPSAESIFDSLSIIKTYIEDSLSGNNSIIFIGDAKKAFHNQINAIFENYSYADDDKNIINSYSLGIAGIEKYNSGFECSDILPLYLKKPQAQRQFEDKYNNLNKLL